MSQQETDPLAASSQEGTPPDEVIAEAELFETPGSNEASEAGSSIDAGRGGEKRDFEGLGLPDSLISYLPFLATVLGVVLGLALSRWVLRRQERGSSGVSFGGQMWMLSLSFLGFLVVLLALPMDWSVKTSLLSFFGLLLSAAIALSSTTILGNMMAGFMLRALRHYKIGDFIRCGDHFGRVTERGVVHTEIQTEERDLTTLPNFYLATNPMTVVRSSGTIVSAEVSLGYDAPRAEVKGALLEAAKQSGLEEPFVHVVSLGDFSVLYRVAGLLPEVKQLFSVRSRLRINMMDCLHAAHIEIVSPTFMNTRGIAVDRPVLPAVQARDEGKADDEAASIEDVVFDKAELAQSVASRKERYDELVAKLDELKKGLKETNDTNERIALKDEITRHEVRMQRMQRILEAREQALEDIDE